MANTGTHRVIVLLGTVINNAKPYTFCQVHVYVHKLSHCFKYLHNRCMGASRNCHRVPFLHCAPQLSGWGLPYRVGLCKCAGGTVHSFTKQKIATFCKRKNTFLGFKNEKLHGFTKQKTATFCKKKNIARF